MTIVFVYIKRNNEHHHVYSFYKVTGLRSHLGVIRHHSIPTLFLIFVILYWHSIRSSMKKILRKKKHACVQCMTAVRQQKNALQQTTLQLVMKLSVVATFIVGLAIWTLHKVPTSYGMCFSSSSFLVVVLSYVGKMNRLISQLASTIIQNHDIHTNRKRIALRHISLSYLSNGR